MVAIKDTEMPKNCKYCTRKTICGAYLNQYIKDPSSLYTYGQGERPDDCPLLEIITCKDCDNRCTGGLCTKHDITVTKDFYCADAERREHETN